MLLVIVGQHSAGKTTLARAISKETGFPIIELGHFVRVEAQRLKVHSLVDAATLLIDERPLAIAEMAIQDLCSRGLDVAILVGPRTSSELDYLKAQVGEILTVGVEASSELRKRRWKRRHLAYDDTWERRELQEMRWGTNELIGLCDVQIDGQLQLEKQVGEVISNLKGGFRHYED